MIVTLYTRAFQLALLSTLIALALGINYLSAWTGPSALPTGNNVAAPINVGTTNQVKDGNLGVGRLANTATDYGLIVTGRVRSTTGGVEFPDGTVQTTAASASGATGAPTMVRSYTANGTWTKPANLTAVQIEAWGGGSGGCTGGANIGGSIGGNSYIQGLTGGPVADGGARSANSGGTGQMVMTGHHFGGGTFGTGGGGGECTTSGNNGPQYNSCTGGGDGGYVRSAVLGSDIPAGTYTVVVGAGGAGGRTNGGACTVNGGAGIQGLVIITEFY